MQSRRRLVSALATKACQVTAAENLGSRGASSFGFCWSSCTIRPRNIGVDHQEAQIRELLEGLRWAVDVEGQARCDDSQSALCRRRRLHRSPEPLRTHGCLATEALRRVSVAESHEVNAVDRVRLGSGSMTALVIVQAGEVNHTVRTYAALDHLFPLQTRKRTIVRLACHLLVPTSSRRVTMRSLRRRHRSPVPGGDHTFHPGQRGHPARRHPRRPPGGLGSRRSRAWLRYRAMFNEVARLNPVNADSTVPERDQHDPSLPQIERFLQWATRAKPK